jgi:hypothetical protein
VEESFMSVIPYIMTSKDIPKLTIYEQEALENDPGKLAQYIKDIAQNAGDKMDQLGRTQEAMEWRSISNKAQERSEATDPATKKETPN